MDKSQMSTRLVWSGPACTAAARSVPKRRNVHGLRRGKSACYTKKVPDTVGVAQLVERWIVVPVAVGSNPTTHPIPNKLQPKRKAHLGSTPTTGKSQRIDLAGD